MHQHAAPLHLLLRLLLRLAVSLILARDAMTMLAVRSDHVVIEQLTLGQELTTARIVPRAPQTAAPALQHLHVQPKEIN